MKIEKPKTYAAKDMYKYWKNKQIKEQDYFRQKGNILYFDPKDKIRFINKQLQELNEELYIVENDDPEYIQKRFKRKARAITTLKNKISKLNKEKEKLTSLPSGKRIQVMNYTLFKEILTRVNKEVSKRMIHDGAVFDLKNRLGFIRIRKIKRNFSKEHVDWPESLKLKKRYLNEGYDLFTTSNPNGKKWLVYRSEEWYLRFAWLKKFGACVVPNQSVYRFRPTANRSTSEGGTLGNKGLLHKANMENPLLHLKYEGTKEIELEKEKL